jgi:hypothetical protein
MTLEDEILIACSRLHFNEVHRDRVTSACDRGKIDWELVCSAAGAHKIAPLVYQNLRSCRQVNDFLPAKVVDEFQNAQRWNAFKNAVSMKRIAELATYFDSREHDVLLLKHAAFSVRLRRLYDVTMSDDLDVVVRPKGELPHRLDERYVWKMCSWMVANRFRKVLRCVIQDPWDPTYSFINDFRAMHDPWRRLIGIELDNRIHHDLASAIPIDFRKVWQEANPGRVDGIMVYVPDLHDLIIMSTVNFHFKPYLRLRNIAEIHELIQYEKDFDWDVLLRKVRAYQCNSLVYSALHTTKAVLECDLPQSVLTALRPGAVRCRAIALINRRVSPSKICRPRNPDGIPRAPRRGLIDLARRFLAMDGRQLLRFVWFRIMLHRLLGVTRW